MASSGSWPGIVSTGHAVSFGQVLAGSSEKGNHMRTNIATNAAGPRQPCALTAQRLWEQGPGACPAAMAVPASITSQLPASHASASALMSVGAMKWFLRPAPSKEPGSDRGLGTAAGPDRLGGLISSLQAAGRPSRFCRLLTWPHTSAIESTESVKYADCAMLQLLLLRGLSRTFLQHYKNRGQGSCVLNCVLSDGMTFSSPSLLHLL